MRELNPEMGPSAGLKHHQCKRCVECARLGRYFSSTFIWKKDERAWASLRPSGRDPASPDEKHMYASSLPTANAAA